jgi:SPP1 family predicted phage head-tail adaptor
MPAGRYRHLITIEQNTPSRDASGYSTDAWTTFATAWAKIESMTGREYLGNEQVKSETTHKFIFRYIDGVLPAMRISWDGRTFDIQSALNVDERDRHTVVMAVERG